MSSGILLKKCFKKPCVLDDNMYFKWAMAGQDWIPSLLSSSGLHNEATF